MSDEQKEVKAEEKLLPQSQVDAIVQDRLARERAKFANYEDLVKFKNEHEKKIEEATQKELEARKEYDQLKTGLLNKEKEYQAVISKKEAEISDMRVSGSLQTEIAKQNAYAEETMALLKSQAVFDKEGNIRIKGRDANGLEVLHSVEEGVKQFLTLRPHLVKANVRIGGGTPPATSPGEVITSTDLSNDLLAAHARGDHKAVRELKTKLQASISKR